jgi:hypothetical protein
VVVQAVALGALLALGTASQTKALGASPVRAVLSVGGGTGRAGGDWFAGFTSGWSAEGELRVAFAPHGFVGLQLRRQALGVEPVLTHDVPLGVDAAGQPMRAEAEWTVRLEEVFAVVGGWTRVHRLHRPVLFVEGGVGTIRHDMRIRLTSPQHILAGYERQTKVGVVAATGLIVPLSRRVGVELGGTVRVTGEARDDGGPNGTGTTVMGTLWGVHLAVVALLGGSR